ncbi:MAG: response regulator transcription factor [Methanosarcina sp.]|nr:response regulator transcription factor [Methanosarcina sp.]
MQNKPILLVDDDPHVSEVLSLYLEKEGYQVASADNGQEALQKIRQLDPCLMVLDVMMPEMDGIEVCRRVRAIKSLPIIMLTAKSEDLDKILGLELGADDYITKPFNPREVVARIKAVLRRTNNIGDNKAKTLLFPQLEIDLSEYRVSVKGKVVALTPKEIELLWLMASHPNMVFTRENLLESVWGYTYSGETRTVDTHVKRLRRKLMIMPQNAWDIKTVWGVGYKFEVK